MAQLNQFAATIAEVASGGITIIGILLIAAIAIAPAFIDPDTRLRACGC